MDIKTQLAASQLREKRLREAEELAQAYEEAMVATNEAGFAGMDAASVIRYMDAELAECRRDAERYRHARKSWSDGAVDITVCRVEWNDCENIEYTILTEERADQALDKLKRKPTLTNVTHPVVN